MPSSPRVHTAAVKTDGSLARVARQVSGLACAMMLMMHTLPAAAAETDSGLPASVEASGQKFARVGGDDLKLVGFRIYHASLWSPSGRYRPDQPLALNLRYERGFSRQELVDITVSAWKKLGLDDAASNKWSKQLLDLWHDVEKGDTVTTVVIPGGETRFYSSNGMLGRIEDRKFGPAFLGIWVDERTQLPDLRAALLGLNKDH